MERVDPRAGIISKRLGSVERIIAVASGKGGVGKSLVSTVLALTLAEENSVGLLDLDFYGPSCHTIIGAGEAEPKEEKGVVPPLIKGVKLMSIAFYSRDKPLPLRGTEVSDAILELLAITIWGKLDYLIVDLPPGMGDAILDVLRYMKKEEVLVVTTPSVLSLKSVEKLLEMLVKLKVRVIGVLENMRFEENRRVEELALKYRVKYLGSIPFDPAVEGSIGDPDALLKTNFSIKLRENVLRVLH